MPKEPLIIILRRFGGRTLESALLILAIALGIGAFSAGLSLVLNTAAYSRSIMASPLYREIVVSTRSEADEMEYPVAEKPARETAVLTVADLEAAELVPQVQWAYVQNHSRLHLISSGNNNFGPPGGMAPPEGMSSPQGMVPPEEIPSTDGAASPEGIVPPEGSAPSKGAASPAGPGSAAETADLEAGREVETAGLEADPRPGTEAPAENRRSFFSPVSDEEIAAAQADPDILISDLDEISGYEVTPQFFNAWEISPRYGSLFTESDSTDRAQLIILGSDLAQLIAGEGEAVSQLPGKRLLTRQGYQTIIGILDPLSESYDSSFFIPYQDRTGIAGDFRRMFMDTRLRFAVADPEELDGTASLLREWFTRQFGEEQIVISNPRAEAMRLVERNSGIGLLILFLSGAGFFIALVNVSNILISRVIRMKKHVGILMALGSSRRGISGLFLAESLIIAVAGGIAGALLALPLSSYMQSAAGIESGTWLFILPGMVLSAILTTLFGLIPSRQYMKIDPAQAMRSVS